MMQATFIISNFLLATLIKGKTGKINLKMLFNPIYLKDYRFQSIQYKEIIDIFYILVRMYTLKLIVYFYV